MTSQELGRRLIDLRELTIWRITRRYNLSKEDAEDLFQVSCIKAIQHIDQCQNLSGFKQWFLVIATHAALNWRRDESLRRAVRGATGVVEDLCVDSHAPTPELIAELHEQMEQVRSALRHLNQYYREVVWRYTALGDLARRVAADMGMSETNVRQLAYKARGELRQYPQLRDYRENP